MTFCGPYAKFQGHGVTIDAIDVLCAQLTRDLFAIAKFLSCYSYFTEHFRRCNKC